MFLYEYLSSAHFEIEGRLTGGGDPKCDVTIVGSEDADPVQE
jgi:hypothetical protein